MMQTMNPVSHIERWGFVVLMKLPAAPPGGISAPIRPRLAGSSLRFDNLQGIPAKADKEILQGCCCLLNLTIFKNS
jgi:hypothetical protein